MDRGKLPNHPQSDNQITDNQYQDTGIMSRNDWKEPGTKQPDFTGTLDFKCEHCGAMSKRRLAAWIKESTRTGRKFFALVFRAAPQQSGDFGPDSIGNGRGRSNDDDVPF
jgi:hypothetical protein